MEKSKLKTVLGTILIVIGFPTLWAPFLVVLFICFVFFLYRHVVHFAAAIFRPDFIPINNAVDNLFIPWPSSARPMSNAAQVWFLSGKLSVDEFREHFYATFLSTEELREIYSNLYCHFVRWGLYCFKKKSELDLKERIHEQELVISNDKDIEQFVADWLNLNDYGERPNWEILLVHIRNESSINTKDKGEMSGDEKKTVVLFKIDHGLCDGYSLLHLLERLTGIKTPYLVKDEQISSWKKVKLFLKLPLWLVGISWKLLKTSGLNWKDGDLPRNPKMFLSFATLDLETVKKIKKLGKCHFNTILGVVQVDALRKLFLESGRVNSAKELPSNIYISSAGPWPRHPVMTGKGLGNHLTGFMFKVNLAEENSAARLFQGEEAFVKMKESGLLENFFLYFLPIIWTFPPCLLDTLKEVTYELGIFSKQTCYFSPLLLSQEHYRLLGIPVEHLYFPLHLQTLTPLRMIVIPLSNGGRLDISVSGRMDSFRSYEEIEYFTKVLMNESLDELFQALVSGQKNEMTIEMDMKINGTDADIETDNE